MNYSNIISSLILILSISVSVFSDKPPAGHNQTSPTPPLSPTTNVVVADTVEQDLLVIKPNDIVIGDKNSKIRVIEYSSFTCYHCADFHHNVIKKFKAEYLDKNLAAYIIRELPSDRQAFEATILARCARVENYYNFVEVLFNQQNNWLFSKDFRAILTQIGQIGGLSAETYSKCLNDQILKDKITSNVRDGNLLKISATPTIYINGKIYSHPHEYEDFIKEVEAARSAIN